MPDSIINEKSAEAHDKRICFNYKISTLIPESIEPVDICTILANKIDNAFEACQRIPEATEQIVSVHIWRQTESIVFFQVSNRVLNNPFECDPELKSKKQDHVRLPRESHSFLPPEDTFNWTAGIFHLDEGLIDFVDAFLSTSGELAFCQIAGHSHDLDTEHMWDVMEGIFQRSSVDPEILPMTTMELIEYLRAIRRAEITERRIQNNSNISLWFLIDGKIYEIAANQGINL